MQYNTSAYNFITFIILIQTAGWYKNIHCNNDNYYTFDNYFVVVELYVILFTVEPLYCGLHWDCSNCPDYRGVLVSECPD